MARTDTTAPLTGSIADVAARLALWGRRAPKGLARVEFVSDFSRQEVVSELRLTLPQDKPLHEIELPFQQPAVEVVRFLRERLRELPLGVVSITGFATAFSDDCPLVDSLRVLNFHRENLAQLPLCQIWWMTHPFADTFLRSVPDLDSWFMLRLNLTEVIATPAEDIPEYRESTDSKYARTEADRQAKGRLFSSEYTGRFEKAIHLNPSAGELIRLAYEAVTMLCLAGLRSEGKEVAQILLDKMKSFLVEPWLDENLASLDLRQVGVWRYCQHSFGRPENLRELAYLYEVTEDFDNAEIFYRASLNMVLGAWAINTFEPIEYDAAFDGLMGFYIRRGRYIEAEDYCERWIDTKRKTYNSEQTHHLKVRLGEDFNHFSYPLCALLEIFLLQQRYSDAEQIYYKMQAYMSVSSEEHRLRIHLNSQARMANVYKRLGRYMEAEMLAKQAQNLSDIIKSRD